MNVILVILGITIGAVVAWGIRTKDERFGVPWSDISQTQLKLHHDLAIAMADRAHLDPACRALLRHQVKLLKSVGVVGREALDVTPSVMLEPPKRQEDEFVKVSENKWVRNEEKQEGFGLYPRDSESE